jgi:4'-phosphopantetheinyl transferase EntD
MMSDMVPPPVAVSEAFGDLPDVSLFPEEAAVIARAIEKRRREFATSRACARAALAKLGVPPAPILPGPRGAPRWPAGVVGSITHCAGYRASAVALDRDVVTIGVDAEPHERLPAGVREAVAFDGERDRLEALEARSPDTCWDRILFCAKEAVYKAWFPLTHRWLGFEQACVDLDPVNGTFRALLLVDGPVVDGGALTSFEGRWLVSDSLIGTAVVVLRTGGIRRPRLRRRWRTASAVILPQVWGGSSAGQSSGLIIRRSWVRSPAAPPTSIPGRPTNFDPRPPHQLCVLLRLMLACASRAAR